MNPNDVQDFKNFLGNWMKGHMKHLDSVSRLSIQRSISIAIDEYARERGNPFAEKTDVLDLIISTLREHERELDRLINNLRTLPSRSGDLVTARAISTKVKVGTQSRAVLPWFDPGTILMAKVAVSKYDPDVVVGVVLSVM